MTTETNETIEQASGLLDKACTNYYSVGHAGLSPAARDEVQLVIALCLIDIARSQDLISLDLLKRATANTRHRSELGLD